MAVFISDTASIGTPNAGTIRPKPEQDIDGANKINSKDAQTIDNANSIASEDSNTIDLPNPLNSENVSDIDTPNTIDSNDIGDIDAPNTISSEDESALTDANVLNPQSESSLSIPNEIDSKSTVDIDTPNVLSSESESGISIPNELDPLTIGAISTPNTLSSLSGGSIAPPNVFVPNDPLAPPYPLSHARILYDNLFDGSTTSPAAAVGMMNPNTYEAWNLGTGYKEAIITADTNQTIDCIAIGAHNLGSENCTIQVQTAATEGGTFTNRGSFSPSDNRALMILLTDEISVRQIKLLVTAGDGGTREIGVLYAGKALAMQRPIFGGHAPILLNSKTTYTNSSSEKGNWLGRSIIRNGYETSYNWSLLTDEWYRDNFQPFVEVSKRKPFFIAWRPDLYPSEVAYCWRDSDISPSNKGGGTRYMDVSVSVQGYASA